MKESVLKRAAALFAVLIMVFSASTGAFAATAAPETTRPRPTASASPSRAQSNSDADTADDNGAEAATPKAANTAASTAPASTTQTSAASNKNYTTRGGAFLWFLLSVIVNAVISFAIGNRFYKLSKKETHVTAEIRALRRDIEEKFADSIGGFSEQGLDIENSNDNYAMKNDGLKMTPASTTSVDAPVGDIYKQWEEQMAKRRAARRAAINTRPEIDESELEDEKPSKKKYQPKRSSFREETEEYDIDELEDELDEEKEQKSASVTKKAKKFINEIFPLKDDEDNDEI